MSKTLLRKAWDEFIQSFKTDLSDQEAEVERAIGFGRMREQLWTELENVEQSADGWIWPIDIFVDDDGSLFSIVAQSGKLYQVPIAISGDTMSLGTWTQVTEVFKPVEQQSFRVIRTSEGRHRFIGVAASSVLNRVAEIDSRDLFDCFIEDVAETGNWPRLDFYHLGRSNEEAWEFGTVDFHARDGVCYVVSGLFDEDHPLAKATIQAYERDPEAWGFSIEFYAFGEAEVIVVEPEIRVPVYKRGRILRVSIVKEQDAANLFTRVANITEEKVRMKRDTLSALTDLFGSDDAAKDFLAKFELNVDGVNRSVTEENLVHRTTEAASALTEAVTEQDEEEETEESEDLEMSEGDVEAVAQHILGSPAFKAIGQALLKIQTSVDALSTARAADAKEIAVLKEANATSHKRLATVEKAEEVKKTEYQQDMPARTTRKASFRPRDQYAEDGEETTEDLSSRAERTLAKVQAPY